MSRKIIAVVGVLVICLVVTLTVASASPDKRTSKIASWARGASSQAPAHAGAPNAPQGAETFTVRERQTRARFVDTGPKGDSTGDYFLFRSDLYMNGQRVGTDNVKCTLSFRLAQCEAVGSFNGQGGIGRGQIAVAGVAYNRNPFVLPITGGTRAWFGAGGQVVVTDVSDTTSLLTFEVTR